MKYFTFVASILTLFFVCQETFAQVQPDNTSKSLDINQVNKRLEKLETELDGKQKDWLDVIEILGTILTPLAITFLGYSFQQIESKKEEKRDALESKREKERDAFEQEISQINAELEKKRFAFEQEISQINAEREENRDAFEQQIAQINTKARQAELLSKLMPTLLSKDSKERTLGIKAISLALPEEGEALVAVLSETDPSEKVRDIAQESLKILRLENKVRNKYELEHLYRIYEGEKQPRRISFKNRRSFRAELRHLRTLGLIENQPDKTIGGMPDSGDLRDHVKLTQDGKDYIENRETYGLANPRREKNSEFWSSANNN